MAVQERPKQKERYAQSSYRSTHIFYVQIKFIAPNIDEIPARCRLKIAKSLKGLNDQLKKLMVDKRPSSTNSNFYIRRKTNNIRDEVITKDLYYSILERPYLVRLKLKDKPITKTSD